MPIILVIVALAAAGWLGFMAAAGAQYSLIMLMGTAMVALFAFFSPKLSLVLLVFSMLLSPEINLAGLAGAEKAGKHGTQNRGITGLNRIDRIGRMDRKKGLE